MFHDRCIIDPQSVLKTGFVLAKKIWDKGFKTCCVHGGCLGWL